MKRKYRILFIIFIILCFLMFCDAVLMFYNDEINFAIKDILFGIGFGSIGVVYLFSSEENK